MNNLSEIDILQTNSLNEIFLNNKITLEEKIETFRKINKIIMYNEDIKNEQINLLFFINVLNNIHSIFNTNDTEYTNKNKVLYLKLYLMYLYNISNSESSYRKKLFNQIFQTSEINKIFNDLILKNIDDLKVQKFILGILHNLIFNQTSNLKELKHIVEFIRFFCLIINKILQSYDNLREVNKLNKEEFTSEEKDLNEINDWLHLIFNLIMKNENKIILNTENLTNEILIKEIMFSISDSKNNKTKEINLFDLLINKNIVGDFFYIYLEIFRDCVENSKNVDNEKYFLVHKNNFKILINQVINNISNLELVIKELIKTKNFEKMHYYTFDKLSFKIKKTIIDKIEVKTIDLIENYSYCDDEELRKILAFKEFICFVDIFSIFLITDEYREFLFEFNLEYDFIDNLYSLIKETDFIYDDYFMRFKSLKKSEMLNYDFVKLKESSVFFSFQTNVMKFLSNYAFKNEKFKEKLISDPELFLRILNHMKIDNCNPFKKEWTILMVKSLCESKNLNLIINN